MLTLPSLCLSKAHLQFVYVVEVVFLTCEVVAGQRGGILSTVFSGRIRRGPEVRLGLLLATLADVNSADGNSDGTENTRLSA